MLCFQTNLMPFRHTRTTHTHTHIPSYGPIGLRQPNEEDEEKIPKIIVITIRTLIIFVSVCVHVSVVLYTRFNVIRIANLVGYFLFKRKTRRENSLAMYSCAWEKAPKEIYYTIPYFIWYKFYKKMDC